MEALLEQLVIHLSYVGVALTLVASGVGVPIAEEMPLIIGGWLCHEGHAHMYIMLPVAYTAVLAGDVILYALGRRYGHHVPKLPLLGRFLTEERLLRAERALYDHAGKTIFCARFVPGIRAAVWFSSGVLKVPSWKFIMYDGLAAMISTPFLLALGYLGAEHLPAVRKWAGSTQLALGAVIVICFVCFIVYRRRRSQGTGMKVPPALPGRQVSKVDEIA